MAADDASATLVVVAHAGFFAVSLLLVRIDVMEHRLPDAIVLPATLGLAALFAVSGVVGGDLAPVGRAAGGGLMLFSAYLALRAAAPAGLGGGDVKLAGLVGVFLGWHGWTELVVGAAAAFVLGAACALALLVAGRAGRDTRIAFGPWMLVGAWTAPLVA
ncbi:prepilin peptidase [Microbacterium marinilacus]|uniref:Prepilin type IV endopeptidase peptidase domain-containing protein n=1 Tax=Microbacterium marinilacus TaxID=415209 RepID=A0ABP7B4G9_9MICO|nr:prepilin peptidase [Microbacterium marinilacus]MBY0687776.1 prepilin peptidase [Microbacterium marinilacus]